MTDPIPASVDRSPVPPARRRVGLVAATLGVALAVALAPQPASAAEPDDPRLELVRLQLAEEFRGALASAGDLLRDDPPVAREIGVDYLRGHLLEMLGRSAEARERFTDTMAATPPLSAHARYRLAVNHAEDGHPEMAAGLVAHILSSHLPPHLTVDASRLLAESLERGGDCRLLRSSDVWPLPPAERRRLEVAAAECALGRGEAGAAAEGLVALLRGGTGDGPAHEASHLLTRLSPLLPVDRERHLLLARAFFDHREFEPAVAHFEAALEEDPLAVVEGAPRLAGQDHEDRYALARSYFWLGRYPRAAAIFAAVARRAARSDDRARAFYQEGRSLELAGDWRAAAEAFAAVAGADPDGGWAGAALLSRLRIAWRLGREEEALVYYDELGRSRRWRDHRRLGALFLAVSDLVRRRPERAGAWLDDADRDDADRAELAYWRGRLYELEGSPASAVGAYLDAVDADPHHPLADAARERLRLPPLGPVARREGLRLATSSGRADLHRAWHALGEEHPGGREARRRLAANLASEGRNRPFFALSPVPPEEWPVWRERDRRPEELLLKLGIWGEAAPVVLRHFPVSEPSLAYTGSLLLARGGATRRSLYVAEVLADRVPGEIPQALLPAGFRRLLYPLPWGALLFSEAGRHRVDPWLLAAVVREESRFDPRAVSAAQARGLTQFVLSTARRVGARIGLPEVAADDLFEPRVAIALGAAYPAELGERYGGNPTAVLAAYNAGEPQADLWRSYCYSRDPAEYFSKVGFRETRNYLRKVLSSRAHYRELWPDGPARPAEAVR